MTNASFPHLECSWISALVPQGLVRRIFGSLLATACLGSATSSSSDTLQIYFVDVEGGQATLFVAPAGSRCSSTRAGRAMMAAMRPYRGCGQKGSD